AFSGVRKWTKRSRKSNASENGPTVHSGTPSLTPKAFADPPQYSVAREATMASSTQRVQAALERWAREVYGKAAHKPGALRRPEFETTSGIELQPLYGPRNGDYQEKLGFPGEDPYTRSVQLTMYRGRFYTMVQYAGLGTAEETNE